MKHLKDQRGVALVLELILVAAVLAVAGLGVYTAMHRKTSTVATKVSPSPSKSASPTPTPTPTPDPYAGWKQGSLASEKLMFKYPSNWTLSTPTQSGYTGFVALKDNTGFVVDIDAFKSNTQNAALGGSLGATTFNTTVSKLSLGGKSAYLIDDLNASMYSGTVLSSCTGSKKCLYASPVTGDDIEVTIVFNAPGKTDFSGGPDNFSPSAAGYKQALQIANTLSF